MLKYILIAVGALLLTMHAEAQKKEISQARTYIKSGKDFDKAEKLLTDLMAKDSTARDNKKVLATWFDAVYAQYLAGNEKLYLHQKYDTAAFFGLTRRLYSIAEHLDSVDMRPDKKGRVRPEYRKKHAQVLNQLRPNLYFGATKLLLSGKTEEAYDYYATYVDTDTQPLFKDYHYGATDSLVVQAAYWASYCGHKLNDSERTLKYSDIARRDTSKLAFTLQYVCEAYLEQENDSAYIATLHEGFDIYPKSPYFFPRLADYYKSKDKNETVLSLASHGLEVDSSNTLFLLAKSIALLNMERYDECIAASREIIEINDTLPEPYYNIATCYLNQALELEQLNEPRLYRDRLHELYANARPYMESYRRLNSADQQRWAPALYRIYLNLNMGKQFDEMDKLLRK